MLAAAGIRFYTGIEDAIAFSKAGNLFQVVHVRDRSSITKFTFNSSQRAKITVGAQFDRPDTHQTPPTPLLCS